MSITPQQASDRLSLAQRKFSQQAEKLARDFANRVGIRAVNMPHMRQTSAVAVAGVPGLSAAGRRKKGDSGPLRRVHNRLAKSILPGGTFLRPEAIERVSVLGFKLRLEKGSRVPYAGVHEYGFHGSRLNSGATVRIPARPYMGPATRIEKTLLARRAGKEMKDMILTVLRTGT